MLCKNTKFRKHCPYLDIKKIILGNGRVGRLIMFRECLRHGIVPFIITDDLKMFYYNGLHNWPNIKGYLMDTCLTAQDAFKLLLDKFRIKH
jgi:hypothetical protein